MNPEGKRQVLFSTTSEDRALKGILRCPERFDTLVVMVPALTGTRTGPQRLFVDLAHHLLQYQIASLCLELPPNGDSQDHQHAGVRNWATPADLNRLVARYLQDVTAPVRQLAPRIIWLSISWGCIPMVEFIRQADFSEAILLSPSTIVGPKAKVDTSNLRAYYLKIFQKNTWKKLLRFQIRPRRIFYNIFPRRISDAPAPVAPTADTRAGSALKKVLCLYGEKDPEIERYRSHWANEHAKGKLLDLQEDRIAGADHSFSAWTWKQALAEKLVLWINKEAG